MKKPETKKCAKCGEVLPLSSFYTQTTKWKLKDGTEKSKQYYQSCCITCNKRALTARKYRSILKKHERLNKIDIAISTDEGFDNLLKEHGL